MLLAELENKFIKPLPKLDKLQLIVDVTKMLQHEEQRPEKYFQPGTEYPIITPTITQDDSSYKSAYQLQQLWEDRDNT